MPNRVTPAKYHQVTLLQTKVATVDKLKTGVWNDVLITYVVVSNMFHVHSYLGKIPILTNIFSDGLKPPTSNV